MPIVLAVPVALALTAPVEAAAPVTLAQAWAAIEPCRPAPDPVERDPSAVPRYELEFACLDAAKTVLALGDADDRERLWDLNQAAPQESLFHEFLFPALIASHLEEAATDLEGIRSIEPFAPPPGAASQAGRELADASPELRRAIALAESVRHRESPQSAAPPDERIVYSSPEGRLRLEQVVGRALRGQADADETRRLLDGFEYGFGCGNGAEELEQARSAARFVLALREGRVDVDAVLGSALALREPAQQPLRRRLLAAVGIDWEPLDVGLLLFEDRERLEPLLRAGSDRAAGLLLELATLAMPHDLELAGALLFPLAGFVTPGGSCAEDLGVSSEDVERDLDAPAIDDGIQQAILDRLHEAVRATASLDEATGASHALMRACRQESRRSFQAMRESPFFELRRRGALALRALGDEVEDPVPPPPVAVRLQVDGRDWSGPVRWVLESKAGERTGEASAGAGGLVHLDRDPFVDPKGRVEAVRLEAPAESAEDTWFSARAAAPSDLRRATLLSVRTGTLTVAIPSRAQGLHGPPSLWWVEWVDSEGRPDQMVLNVSSTRDRHVFRLQRGSYRVRLQLPDGSQRASRVVQVGARPERIELLPAPEEEETAIGPDEPSGVP